MCEAQEGSCKYQRNGEEFVDRRFLVGKRCRVLRDQAFYDEVAHNSQGESDAAGLEDVEFDDLLEPLHDEIGAEGENHD